MSLRNIVRNTCKTVPKGIENEMFTKNPKKKQAKSRDLKIEVHWVQFQQTRNCASPSWPFHHGWLAWCQNSTQNHVPRHEIVIFSKKKQSKMKIYIRIYIGVFFKKIFCFEFRVSMFEVHFLLVVFQTRKGEICRRETVGTPGRPSTAPLQQPPDVDLFRRQQICCKVLNSGKKARMIWILNKNANISKKWI